MTDDTWACVVFLDPAYMFTFIMNASGTARDSAYLEPHLYITSHHGEQLKSLKERIVFSRV